MLTVKFKHCCLLFYQSIDDGLNANDNYIRFLSSGSPHDISNY